MYSHHFEGTVTIDATPDEVFAEIDDHERLASHMMQSSMMMGGGSMQFHLDGGSGRSVGSVIRMTGKVLGMNLEVEEKVTERAPPTHKAWETITEPRLFVIGRYRMGFDIAPRFDGSRLVVFIEYEDPAPPWTMLGRLLGPVYARWCTKRMTRGTRKAFQAPRNDVRPGDGARLNPED